MQINEENRVYGGKRRKRHRSASERFRDNRPDIQRVTIANHNSDRKTRMTG